VLVFPDERLEPRGVVQHGAESPAAVTVLLTRER
jgi:hypothetical protein